MIASLPAGANLAFAGNRHRVPKGLALGLRRTRKEPAIARRSTRLKGLRSQSMGLDHGYGDVLIASQHIEWSGSGVTHPKFLAILGALTPSGKSRLEPAGPAVA